MAEIGRTPDFNLSAMDKNANRKGQVGCAWENEDGTIAIRLNFGVVLDTNLYDYVLTLFPKNYKPREKRPQRKVQTGTRVYDDLEPAPHEKEDGEIPF